MLWIEVVVRDQVFALVDIRVAFYESVYQTSHYYRLQKDYWMKKYTFMRSSFRLKVTAATNNVTHADVDKGIKCSADEDGRCCTFLKI